MSDASPLAPIDEWPNLSLATLRIRYQATHDPALQSEMIAAIRADKMIGWYRTLCQDFHWSVDQDLMRMLEGYRQQVLAELAKALEDAKGSKSEEDVRVAHLNIALCYLKIGDLSEMRNALREARETTVAVGQKLDTVFAELRAVFFFGDFAAVPELLALADKLATDGGDWERKNRLKSYKGLYECARRNFRGAAELFTTCLATFTATELLPYEDFLYRAVVLAVLALDRAEFAKLSKAVEIRQRASMVEGLLGLYALKYDQFFDALVALEERMASDVWFSRHLAYLIKELRIKAYAQFLQPYDAVSIDAMARAFRVTPQFIESEMKRFIFAKKINAKIDRVDRVIQGNPPDSRATKMREAVRSAEVLVSRLQKLGRILSA